MIPGGGCRPGCYYKYMITEHLITSLLLILAVAWALGYLFSRAGLPLMLGELLAGIILGPPLLGWVTPTPGLELMADFGIFFAMFYAGVELDPRETAEHFRPSVLVAFIGAGLPLLLGLGVTLAFGGTVYQALFVGLGVSVTAVAVQSVILKSLRINRTELGHIIIGAAIVNDVLALIGLSFFLGLAQTGHVALVPTLILIAKIALFFGLTILLGEFVMPRFTKLLTDEAGKTFTFAMLVALGMAYLAELAGLHLIIGAFLAGQFVRREIMNEEVYEAIADRFYGIAYGFLMPIFFASLAFHLHVDWTWPLVGLAVALTAAAIIGKVVGAGVAARIMGYNFHSSLVVGVGMNGRGAVELVVATVVIKVSDKLLASGVMGEPLLTQPQFSALVIMAFVTTFITPLALRWSVLRACNADETADICTLMDNTPGK